MIKDAPTGFSPEQSKVLAAHTAFYILDRIHRGHHLFFMDTSAVSDGSFKKTFLGTRGLRPQAKKSFHTY